MFLNNKDLYLQLLPYENSVKWLQYNKLIKNIQYCKICKKEMKLGNRKDKKLWMCYKCNTEKGIFVDSLFTNTKLEPLQIIELIYLWSKGMLIIYYIKFFLFTSYNL